MKKNVKEFFLRGLIACGFGPIVLAMIYLVLCQCGVVETLTVTQVCRGIFSLSALAFLSGGMNVLYQMERLPLMAAILIHGIVLYLSYLAVFLINGWLRLGTAPLLIFTVIFILGYLVIWAVIYAVTKRNTERLNRMLKQKQQREAS